MATLRNTALALLRIAGTSTISTTTAALSRRVTREAPSADAGWLVLTHGVGPMRRYASAPSCSTWTTRRWPAAG